MMTDSTGSGSLVAAGSPGRSPRLSLWIAFLVYSCITLASSVEIKNDAENPTEAVKWAIACSAITFSTAAIVCIMHVFPIVSTFIVGTVSEGIISFVLVGFWAATVAIVTKTSNDLAFISVDSELNANLFFFSWAGFVTSLVLFVNYLKSVLGVDVLGVMNQRSARLTLWSALLATSFIVMGSSLRVTNDDCTTAKSGLEAYCTRANFGIALGAIGSAFSLLVLTLKLFCHNNFVVCEFVLAIALVIMNGIGVGFITSKDGPGSSLGNLWMGSWLSFLESGAIAAECFNHYVRDPANTDEQKNLNHDSTLEIDVEESNDI